MNILFLTLLDYKTYDEVNIYCDLMRELGKHGHKIFSISPRERKYRENTQIVQTDIGTIIKPRITNIQKTNIFEKGYTTLTIDSVFKRIIRHKFSNIKFDLVLYSTPPITFVESIKYVKKRDDARSYLMLKDIFPQNAVDLGLLTNKGLKGILLKYFHKKEKELYAISDKIGCMSPANIDYILKNNPELDKSKVELFPNCIEVSNSNIDIPSRNKILHKYNIPTNKVIFIYGGNLGKPQGIDFMLRCFASQANNTQIHFVIVGSGTEYQKLVKFIEISSQQNITLLKHLSKGEYDKLVAASDIGMIFLDNRFTIPNFPSRLLSYLQAKIPVYAVTDSNTDIGSVITSNRFGWWSESTSTGAFEDVIREIMSRKAQIKKLGLNGFEFLSTNYNVAKEYKKIV